MSSLLRVARRALSTMMSSAAIETSLHVARDDPTAIPV